MRLVFAAALAVALLAALPAGSAVRPAPPALIAKGLAAAVEAGRLSPGEAASYTAVLAEARGELKRVPPLRAQLLAAVIADVAAQWRGYTRPRALTLFSTLSVNTQWLAGHKLTGPHPDIAGDDGAVYRFFSSHGYVFHPLANFARLNSEVAAGDLAGTEKLTAALLARAVPVGQKLLWEYEFPFSTGRAPWTSGMVQAVAAQALARAGDLLSDPALLDAADGAYRAVAALLSPSSPAKPWVALYSFDRTPVLNAQLQAVLSIGDYAAIAGDPAADALAARLTDSARTLLPRFDTGYWSLYSLKGDESSLDYHDYVVALLGKIGTRTGEPAWKEVADRFRAYETQPPLIRPRAGAADGLPQARRRVPRRGGDQLLALEALDGHAAGRRPDDDRDARARREHDQLAGDRSRTRRLPSAAERRRAGGTPRRGGPAAGDRRARARAAAGGGEGDRAGDAFVAVGRRGDALARAPRAPPPGRNRADARARQARPRRHRAPAASARPLARDAARLELGRKDPLRLARVPARDETSGRPAPRGRAARSRSPRRPATASGRCRS